MALAVAAVVTGCAVGTQTGGAPHGSNQTRSTASGSTLANETGSPADEIGHPGRKEREQALAAVLRSRANAVGPGDRSAWLAPLASSLRAEQAAVLDRMTAMRAAEVQLVAVTETQGPSTSGGGPVTWEAIASFTYRLAGFDEHPRSFGVDLAATADPARPEALTITEWRPSPRPEAWDLPGLRVRRSGAALVLAVGSDAHVDEVVARVASSARDVRAVWGSAEPAVWIAPGTDADAARLLGREAADLSGVAAAIDGPLGPGGRAGADRVVIVPGAWRSLAAPGRAVVLTHELTHATVRASTTRPVPVWLSEGFAEYVAYRDVRLPELKVMAPALEVARRTGLPSALPATTDFDPVGGTLPAAYASSLLVVRTLVAAHGESAVVRLYREAAGEPAPPDEDPEAALDRSLVTILSTDRTAVIAGWRSRMSALLAD